MNNFRIDTLPSRQWAHPFDRPVKVEGDEDTHGLDRSPNAIGGYYGIGWSEYFRCHRTGEVYAVHCNDGVNHSKSSHSNHDMKWMRAMRDRIIARTRSQRSGVIVLSTKEWAIMLTYRFEGWLDPIHDEEGKTVGDQNRHLDEGQIGSINGVPVVVDPKAIDDLPKVGEFTESRLESLLPSRSSSPCSAEPTSRFDGVFAAAFAKAGLRAP